ncbi:MAG: YggT family protein [Gallionellaceae bacterium]|jgi:YggT family protein
MLQQTAQFLLDVLLQPFAFILLLRFHLQWLRAPMRNPFGEFIMALTNFIVLPTRRYIPSFRGYDSATLLLAYIFEIIYVYLSEFIWIYASPDGNYLIVGLLVMGVVKLLSLSITLLMIAAIIQAIMSWINPHTTLTPILNALTAPFIRPLQRHIPPVGNVDLSVFALIIICQLLLLVPLNLLDGLARSLI